MPKRNKGLVGMPVIPGPYAYLTDARIQALGGAPISLPHRSGAYMAQGHLYPSLQEQVAYESAVKDQQRFHAAIRDMHLGKYGEPPETSKKGKEGATGELPELPIPQTLDIFYAGGVTALYT